MNGKERIKFGIVGMGLIGKRHAAMVKGNSSAGLVAVCDIRPRGETGYDGEEPYYDCLESMIAAHQDIDVVNICAPNGLHASLALSVLESGRHVVIEKPMTLCKADAEKVIFKSLQMSKNVFVVMQNRYSPPAVWLKDMIIHKRLGDIFMVQLNCYWNRDERYYSGKNWHGTADLDGGTLFTQFSHFIDMLYWLLGDITNIKASFRDFNHQQMTAFEDSGCISFDLVNGGMGTLNYSTSVWDCNMESSMTIIGSKGSVKVAGQYMNEVVYCHVKDYVMPQLPPSNPPNDYGGYKGSAANHHHIIDNVVNTLTGNTTIGTNALEGLKVVEIIERIYSLK
jgi:predicted dehydrogenase